MNGRIDERTDIVADLCVYVYLCITTSKKAGGDDYDIEENTLIWILILQVTDSERERERERDMLWHATVCAFTYVI